MGRIGRAGWSIADQAVSSLTNFALAVIAARLLDAEEFGGFAADVRGIDAMFIATLVLLIVALGPLAQLRRDEHYVDGPAANAVFDGESG